VKPGARLADRHPLRVLVAEDNVVNQKVALAMLRSLGYRADLAADGVEAVEAVRRVPYDVVFMDLQMPELDGMDATKQIIAEHPVGRRPRIVALTANAFEEDREACLNAGMDDYISKPLKPETLEAVLLRSERLAHTEHA
jgi:CheY-like chemotaxis protein